MFKKYKGYLIPVLVTFVCLFLVSGIFIFKTTHEPPKNKTNVVAIQKVEKQLDASKLRIMTDEELNQVIGQSGGLFLTETFGFSVPNDITNYEAADYIQNKMEEIKDPKELLLIYISIIDGLNKPQVDEVTKVVLKQIMYGGIRELINLSKIAGLDMEIRGYDIKIVGNFDVMIR